MSAQIWVLVDDGGTFMGGAGVETGSSGVSKPKQVNLLKSAMKGIRGLAPP